MIHEHESRREFHSKEYKLLLFLFHATIIEFAAIFYAASARIFHGLGTKNVIVLLLLPFKLLFTTGLRAGINGMMIGIGVAGGIAIYFVLKQYDFDARPYFTLWATVLLLYIMANVLLHMGGMSYFPAKIFEPHF